MPIQELKRLGEKMKDILYVAKYEKPADSGGSVPIIVTDVKYNKQYLLKTRYDNGLAKKDYTIFNEMLSYMLIEKLNMQLNIPEIVYFAITKRDIKKIEDDFKGLKHPGKNEAIENIRKSIGINIGIEWIHNCSIPPSNHSYTKVLKENLTNIDAYVANTDRTIQNPNLLLSQEDNKIYTIDFGAAFGSYTFYDEINDLLQASSFYDKFIFDTDYLFYNDLDRCLRKRISVNEIIGLIDSMPTHWQPVKKFKEQIANIISNRVGNKEVLKKGGTYDK